MNRTGNQLKAGDTIKVWWKPKQETIAGFIDSIHARSRRAVFLSGRKMTIFDDASFEIANDQ